MSGYRTNHRLDEVQLGHDYYCGFDIAPERRRELRQNSRWRKELSDDEKEIEPLGLKDLLLEEDD